jgi:spore coat protein D
MYQYGLPFYGPAHVLPPVVHPIQNCVEHVFTTTIVPNVFPSHETIVNTNLIQPENYFPHSTSIVNAVQPLPPVNHPPFFDGVYPGFGPGYPGVGAGFPVATPFGAPGTMPMGMAGMPGTMPMGMGPGMPGTMPMGMGPGMPGTMPMM